MHDTWTAEPSIYSVTLRYLAGGSLIDQFLIYKMMDKTLRNTQYHIKRTLELLHDVLPKFELREVIETRDEARLDQISHGFAAKCDRFLPGVIGAIDGILMPIRRLRSQIERAFYSRKGFFALNVQAISDSKGRFLHASLGHRSPAQPTTPGLGGWTSSAGRCATRTSQSPNGS